GLLGVSEMSQDMRTLLASADARAKEAVDLFVHRIARETGALAASLGGLDGFVFAGGIGEHAAPVRAAVAERLGWLGARLDRDANAHGVGRIDAPGSHVALWVIPTDEEAMIAMHAREVVDG
ncbi:MAG: acetate kinase, partial [Rhodospirillales bacterium]|nr:acetate kinase [Rhodospirillales bacterium]